MKRDRYNTICAFHALEHSNDPRGFIDKVKELLAARGRLILAVPNSTSAGMKKDFFGWVWGQAPILHIFHFSESNLGRLLEAKGFEIEKVIYSERLNANYAKDILLARETEQFVAACGRIETNPIKRKAAVEKQGEWGLLCKNLCRLLPLPEKERSELMIVAKLR